MIYSPCKAEEYLDSPRILGPWRNDLPRSRKAGLGIDPPPTRYRESIVSFPIGKKLPMYAVESFVY
jgi:hypothetical protein